MARQRKRVWVIALLLLLAMLVSGCAVDTPPNNADDATPDDAIIDDPAADDLISDDEPEYIPPLPPSFEGASLYESNGLTIAIPGEYADQLVVKTELENSDSDTYRYIDVYDKGSIEAAKQDNNYYEDNTGYLFGIVRYTRARYEQYLCVDGSGLSFFATDGEYYYGKTYPTDVRFYAGGGNMSSDSAEWKTWEELSFLGGYVTEDLITRNGLNAYSDSEFWQQEYTYQGEHKLINYYPSYSYNSSKSERYTFVLSQPVKQGKGGIWCVERFTDKTGNTYYYFPNSGQPAADYYAELQQECDNGRHQELLDPLAVAKDFAVTSGYWGTTPVAESFEVVEQD